MVVMVLERVPVGLRGELTRWMLEVKSGVFVGSMSGMVRDRLWEKVCRGRGTGGSLMVHSSDTEQGFSVRECGERKRAVEDFEGLLLVRVKE